MKHEITSGQVELTIVTPLRRHFFHGLTGDILAGLLPEGREQGALYEICPQAKLLHGTVVAVDCAARRVRIRSVGSAAEREIEYDHLVVGYGTTDHLTAVPGLAQHGWSLKDHGGLVALRAHLLSMVAEATVATGDPDHQRRLTTVVVAGGGLLGVEMCAAVAELFGTLGRQYPLLRESPPRIVLAHSGDSLAADLGARYTKLLGYLNRQLDRYGVEVRLRTPLTKVDACGAELGTGDFIPAATVVSTLGQHHVSIPGLEDRPRNAHGRLLTEPTLQVRGQFNVWAGGDAAAVTHPVTGLPCPTNALWAIKHGERIGANIAAVIRGRDPYPFTYRGLGQAASLGLGKGIVELYGHQFTGWPAWILRLFFFLRFMPSRRQAARVVLDLATLPALGRHHACGGDAATGPAASGVGRTHVTGRSSA